MQPGHPQPGDLQPGQPAPAGQRPGQRRGDVLAPRVGAAGDQGGPGELRGSQQPVVVAGQHRHRPRPGAADIDDHPAGPADDIGAAHRPQVRAGQAGAGAQADQPGRAHPPRQRRLRISQRQVPGDLGRAVRGLGPFPGQRRVRRGQRGHHFPGQEPQVGPQRAARRAGQARRADREPLDHRGVQQHLRDRLQAERDAERSQRPPPTAARSPAPGCPARPAPPLTAQTIWPAAASATAATARHTRPPRCRSYNIYTERHA